MKYEVLADAGSVRIDFGGGCIKLPNGRGDGYFSVEIISKPFPPGAYLGMFEVAEKATLSGHDCANQPVHEFDPGVYQVYCEPSTGDVTICKI